MLHYSRMLRQTVTYRIHGPAKEPRQLIIMQRRLPGWTLTKPDAKGMELSEGHYRIPFQLPGGDATQAFEIVQERDPAAAAAAARRARTTRSRSSPRPREFDAKTREALTKVLQLQQAVVRGAAQGHADRRDKQQIVQEQSRLRDNLARVPAKATCRSRYLATLDKQETDLEAIANAADRRREGGRDRPRCAADLRRQLGSARTSRRS